MHGYKNEKFNFEILLLYNYDEKMIETTSKTFGYTNIIVQYYYLSISRQAPVVLHINT